MKNKIIVLICFVCFFACIKQGSARIPNCICPDFGPVLCSEEDNRPWKIGSNLPMLQGSECYQDCNCNRALASNRKCQGADLNSQRKGKCVTP